MIADGGLRAAGMLRICNHVIEVLRRPEQKVMVSLNGRLHEVEAVWTDDVVRNPDEAIIRVVIQSEPGSVDRLYPYHRPSKRKTEAPPASCGDTASKSHAEGLPPPGALQPSPETNPPEQDEPEHNQ